MSGFLAVKSLVRPCIRIMSPLLTVAIVSVVCAIEGTETKSAAAPARAPRMFLTATSLCRVEHMPTRWAYVHTGQEGCQANARFRCAQVVREMTRGPGMPDRRRVEIS